MMRTKKCENCYIYFARLDEKQQYEMRKNIERTVFNATLTELNIKGYLAFESQRH